VPIGMIRINALTLNTRAGTCLIMDTVRNLRRQILEEINEPARCYRKGHLHHRRKSVHRRRSEKNVCGRFGTTEIKGYA
jgi:hypothetical protein